MNPSFYPADSRKSTHSIPPAGLSAHCLSRYTGYHLVMVALFSSFPTYSHGYRHHDRRPGCGPRRSG